MQLTPGTRIEFTRDGRTVRGTITSTQHNQIEAQPDGEQSWVYVQPGRFSVLNEADELYRSRLELAIAKTLPALTVRDLERMARAVGLALPERE